MLIGWLLTFLVAELKLSYGGVTTYMVTAAIVSGVLEVTVGSSSDRLGGLKARTPILQVGLWVSAVLLAPTALEIPPLVTVTLITMSLLSWRISLTSFGPL